LPAVGSIPEVRSQRTEHGCAVNRQHARRQMTDDRNRKAVRGREYAGFVGRNAAYILSLPVRHRATAL